MNRLNYNFCCVFSSVAVLNDARVVENLLNWLMLSLR